MMDQVEKARRAAAIVAKVVANGNLAHEPNDLRDAAHEAHHALSVGLKGSWDRERLNRAMERKGRSYMLLSEIEARAVEQLVCADLGVNPGGDVDRWAMVSCMEAIKNSRMDIGGPDRIADAVRRAMQRPAIRKAADRVLALGDESKSSKKPTTKKTPRKRTA